jgi:hypothetical protein
VKAGRRPTGRAGVSYEASKQIKADVYRSALLLLTSGRVSLPKNDDLNNIQNDETAKNKIGAK